MAKKLPQNIQSLVGETGEKQTLLRLAILTHQIPDWQVFHNLGEAGYDVLLLNSKTDERVRMEVKTRQRIYTTGKSRQTVQFFLTNGEYAACDFLVAHFIDHNGFYIVPKHELKQVNVNDKIRWRFTLSMNKQGKPHPRFEQYQGAWHTLHPDFQKLKI